MKQKLDFTLLVVILIFSCTSEKSMKNLVNCRKLETGMTENAVMQIMGEPSSKRKFYSANESDSLISLTYIYDSPIASEGITILISSKRDSVTDVTCGDE